MNEETTLIKTILVDDEPLIVEGLKSLLNWNDMGYTIVATFSNGHRALKYLEENAVELIITDIRMPVMDGISLMKICRERDWNKYFIVLSGYNDFEYVKEAALVGIENYILKPLSFLELSKTLQQIKDKAKSSQNSQSLAEEGLSILTKNLIYRLITGNILADELCEREHFLPFSLNLSGNRVCQLTYTIDGNDTKLSRNIQEALIKHLEMYTGAFAVMDYSKNAVLILFLCHSPEGIDVISASLTDSINYIRALYNVKSTAIIGEYSPTISSCGKSYKEILAFCQHNARFLKKNADNIIWLPPSPNADLEMPLPDSLDNAAFTFEQILKYTRENMAQDINLKTIANHFKMSPISVGRMFQAKTQLCFTDYINHLRISKAKQYLATTALSAKKISGLVGYRNDQYLSTVFKKVVGITPGEYRLKSKL